MALQLALAHFQQKDLTDEGVEEQKQTAGYLQ